VFQVDDGGVADWAEGVPVGLPENHLRVKDADQQLAIGVKGEILHGGSAEAAQQRTEGLAAVIGAEGPADRGEVDGGKDPRKRGSFEAGKSAKVRPPSVETRSRPSLA
jgi:hypothetical protein